MISVGIATNTVTGKILTKLYILSGGTVCGGRNESLSARCSDGHSDNVRDGFEVRNSHEQSVGCHIVSGHNEIISILTDY